MVGDHFTDKGLALKLEEGKLPNAKSRMKVFKILRVPNMLQDACAQMACGRMSYGWRMEAIRVVMNSSDGAARHARGSVGFVVAR